jgi:3-oxoacyl-[acyl-carrier-protein] synthase II
MMSVTIVGAGMASALLASPGDIFARPGAPAAEFDPAAVLGRGVRYKDRATRLGMVAAAGALADASLCDGDPAGGLTVSGDSVGVVASSNLGNLDTVCRTAEVIASKSVAGASPMDLANASSNVIASSIAIRFGLRGPNVMICNGASSGLDAVHLAAMLIVSGRVPRVVVVGAEPANDVVADLAGRPVTELFDGAVAILLESEAAAAARGVLPRARLGGYARCADAESSVIRAVGGYALPRLWLAGEATALTASDLGIPRQDVAAALRAASGALGVLQVAAGAHWLRTGGDGPVLVTTGAAEDGVSSLLLTAAGAAT